jgi:hypothetical protein
MFLCLIAMGKDRGSVSEQCNPRASGTRCQAFLEK